MSQMPKRVLPLLVATAMCTMPAHAAETSLLITAQDLAHSADAIPGRQIAYGPNPLQFGELTLPKGKGPFPILIWIHGGCWLSGFDIKHSRPFARAMAKEGVAVWNIEYRRVGDPGGGWPGTFLDVARAADDLRRLARIFPLDLDRFFVGGHSAGGQLALWLAGRDRIGRDSDLWVAEPLLPKGVLALAPATGLTALYEKKTCDSVIDKLMSGSPSAVPERYEAAEPNRMLPIRVPQTIVLGDKDLGWTWLGKAYARIAAKAPGSASITVVTAPNSGHFEMIAPQSSTWPIVVQAARRLIRIKRGR
ncbi:alpha/beta hydrolase [Sphingobium boeckii]|uniref:Acetyl esterase/lipase n=1 Tax=Sphingobium boeckii TaxID=1082345 RepID=A0A7W9AFM2_9SPHN|nr:alpha/beta hydrolase [Sphingobium boeckii]MBB5684787.1 acetyl esterase/lipase [Sphingobium boeckii]